MFLCMTSCLHAAVADAVYLLLILLHFCCRNRWGEPSVKTFVCELQIHHEVSDAEALWWFF